ncbi:MAG: GGDEF domain-containing protein [Agathobacter sp.]|nr:GGDEF domain-containing protein [Agathobacter sp.]
MFEKYFNGVIEQVYGKVNDVEKNIVMACYNNSFSVEGLDAIKRYSESADSVFFAWKEYRAEDIVGAYDPFLDVICQMHREYVKGDFDEFLTKCQVYELQRDVLKMYYETGICKRKEKVLLDEVEYEQNRMTKTIALMLKTVAEYKPLMLVVNRFQMASKSTIQLVRALVEEPSNKIGIVLGVNEARIRKDNRAHEWGLLTEKLNDYGQVYHIGSSGVARSSSYQTVEKQYQDYKKLFVQLNNVIELLDYDQANSYFLDIERQIKFEEAKMPDGVKLSLYFMHTQVAILLGDLSKALDIIEDISKLDVPGRESIITYQCSMDLATCYMYQGKLEQAERYAEVARKEAENIGQAEYIFKAEVLKLSIQMSGWHNIFFCVKDVEVDKTIIEKLMHYEYYNHLAHVYIYAYDNRPEVVAKAYRSESALIHFTKGVKLAKKIGNEVLVCNAYQKNAMIASTNGMNEIALIYSIRTFQYIQNHKSIEGGRMLSAIGYNLSALGHLEESAWFYGQAIALFYELQLPEDIAEVCYNFALTCIAQENYKLAEESLQIAIKTVDKLHLNSLRVCNLAKLYAIQALLSVMQGNRFDSERYLLSCAQFLNYILEKQKEEVVHDFARSDDDMCLYHFAKAMHELSAENIYAALAEFEETENYFEKAEGNLFYIHVLYRRSRMELFQKLGRMERFEIERANLLQRQEMVVQIAASLPEDMLNEVRQEVGKLERTPKTQIDELIRQIALRKENKRNKKQLEFISTWQNLLDKTDVRIYEMVKSSIRLFLNRFNNDCALYVHREEDVSQVLYNDTGIFFSQEKLDGLEKCIREYPDGVAVSKISHTFSEHKEMISFFGEDEVCSFVAVPFFKDGQLESYFITYIKMKDNWHDSVNRYLLNEDDLKIYQLLIRELGHAIHRMEYYDKISQMNRRLQEAATTDVLTGITNRMGMYERLRLELEKRKVIHGLGVMFIDLDNFKPYNDTYGHEIGDIVLQGMARIFDEVIGDKGFVSRYGGDEFIIIAYTNQKHEIEAIVQSIYKKIEETDGFKESIEATLGMKVEIEEKHKIGCSIGITTCDEFATENYVDDLIKIADDSLYSVKAAGKGTYIFA